MLRAFKIRLTLFAMLVATIAGVLYAIKVVVEALI